ncbi:MAG: response regulator receiver protein [Methylibium sp. NZG]|nr:MAG: response regulator receiver protein [Methylibium sp. NZG]
MAAIDLFYSYAHEDEPLRDELSGHLKILERRGVIRPWHDRRINPGQGWDQQINAQLAAADLVLMLVSADFINSDYIWGTELEVAMQRHERGEASIVPVLVRPCLIEDAPFASIQGLPTDLRAVTSWPNRDEAWTNVAIGIRKAAKDIQERKAKTVPPAGQVDAGKRPMDSSLDWGVTVETLGLGLGLGVGVGEGEASQPDPLLGRVVDDIVSRTGEAASLRGTGPIDAQLATQSARTLIENPAQVRLLWVDDMPSNNRFEAAALAKLQIEVVTARSTAEALAALDAAGDGFDLIISDWARPEPLGDAPSAGVSLLRQLRARGASAPVLCYHGTFDPSLRRERREVLVNEGAFGEAVLPDQLLAMVAEALRPGAPGRA